MCLIAVGGVIFAVLAAAQRRGRRRARTRASTALRAVFWSAMHVLNVTAKVLIVIGAVVASPPPWPVVVPWPTGSARWSSGRATLADRRAKALAAVMAIGLGILGLIWPLAMAEAGGAGRCHGPGRAGHGGCST